MSDTLTAVVLAAGQGRRMRSTKPKILHELGFRPLVGHVLAAAQSAGAEEVVLVTAPDTAAVAAYAERHGVGVRTALQDPPLGTGHAVMAARDQLPTRGDVVVLFADTPLLEGATIARLARTRREAGAAVAVLGMELDEPGAYGRLVERDGRLEAIVEAAQADEATRAIRLANSGVMAFDAARLPALLDALEARTARDGNAEYYLTDVVEAARARGWEVVAARCAPVEGLGVNDRVQLAEAEAILQARLREHWMRAGVTMLDPASVHLAADVDFGRDVVLEPHVFIGPGVVVEDEVRIRAFSHLATDPPKDAKPLVVRKGAVIGPFARLRSGADVGAGAHVGNFVELKNARLDEAAKANHLAYLGDCRVGAGSNIGAGTITCNYDGFAKWPTTIGRDVFVGSNATLVAPVTIGDGALIGAGSWVGRDVAAGASHVARGTPEQRAGGAERLARHLKRRAGKDG
ncbi:MAG: bifunctional UDP-N-acetylglucosamine diphosphorylase/glucosamine-1-phosphate N-acetyltransferase GlmU [Alphaproteobacteria bacterium]